MKITHSFDAFQADSQSQESVSFVITNKMGGYCCLPNTPSSRYQGIFFNNKFRMFKVIESLQLTNAPPIKELKNKFFQVERKTGEITEYFFMPYGFNSISYELSRDSEVELILDIRESYSSPEFGRHYEIFEENGRIIIKYRQENEFECYLAISGYSKFEKTEKWIKQEYSLDKQRNSPPFEKYVFSALKMTLKKAILSFSFDKEKAAKENDFVSNNLNLLKIKQKLNISNIINKNKKSINQLKDKELKLAYICALNSLDNLVVNLDGKSGIFAGLPWFFQFWARDEAISAESLKRLGREDIANKILYRLIEEITDGKLPNKYPNPDSYSADSLGWLFKRIEALNKKLAEDIKIKDILSALDGQFALNDKRETWMDSIDRSGIRIEMQALKLIMLKNNKSMQKRLKDRVKGKFWNRQFLYDGVDDKTIRPNMFIAAYIYPELLTKKEWSKCFENALTRLWLDWGGLSTIDRKNPLFCSFHSGQDPASYHNGDSWFWLNNLAALVLYKTDKQKFSSYINEIINASKNEMLWKGAIGHHAELSSANSLASEGCVMQAWSAAMFIELVDGVLG